MALFDTHAHLTDERFADDLPAVLDRAAAAGVERTIAVAVTDSAACVALAARFADRVSASVGVQPNHVGEVTDRDWDDVVELANRPEVVAVGETGLDRYWDRAPFALQEEWFARHLELAGRLRLPVIIHCREAEADVVRMLTAEYDRRGPIAGVMHSYCGDADSARACLDMGLHVSFAGMVTYKTADDLRAVARTIPLDRLLVETDCPYLAPVPVRGQRNEPAYVAHTAALLARERGELLETLAAATTANARRLFPRR